MTLWTIQGALSLLFLFAGGSKLMLPTTVLLAQMALPLPIWFIRFVGLLAVFIAYGRGQRWRSA